MRNKSVFLLLACVCGTIAAIGVSQWMQAQSTSQNAIETVEIFVTAKTIDVAEEITPDKIRLEQWPADRVPEGATSQLEDLEGRFARQRFYAGEPVMPVKLMTDANGSSQTIPKGYSVVSMKADSENAVANLVRPGDRVDVMSYFTKSEIIPETMAKTVLRGIRVFAVDGRTEREENEVYGKSARTISLLIHSSDAEAWTYATELGKIRLKLVNPGDYASSPEGDGDDDAHKFLKWLADHQRAQEERARKQAEEKAKEPQVAQKLNKKASGFKMMKITGNKLTEYEWVADRSIPVIVNESGGDVSGGPAQTSGQSSGGNTSSTPDDYSFLNGANSPFFQPPSGGQTERSRQPPPGDGGAADSASEQGEFVRP